MKFLIPRQFYILDYGRLFISIGATAAIAFIIYTTLFGSVW